MKLLIPRRHLIKAVPFVAAAPYIKTAKAAFAQIQAQSDPWINLDGRNSTPSGFTPPVGNPQFPRLLYFYFTRPPWRVAGVDYYCGIDASTTLANWNTLIASGNWTFSGTGNTTATLTASNITVNGIDFSIDNGSGQPQVLVGQTGAGVSNTVFSNCKFGGNPVGTLGSALTTQGTSSNITIVNCESDGRIGGFNLTYSDCIFPRNFNGSNVTTNAGNVKMYYNYFHHGSAGPITLSWCNVDARFNLMWNCGNWPTTHLNYWGYLGNNGGTPFNTQGQCLFNTIFQELTNSSGEMFQFYNNSNQTTGAAQANTIGPFTCGNNTLVCFPGNALAAQSRTPSGVYALSDCFLGTAVGNSGVKVFTCTQAGTAFPAGGGSNPASGYAAATEGVTVNDGTTIFKALNHGISTIFHGSNDPGFPTAATSCSVQNNYVDQTGALTRYYTTGGNSFGAGWTVTGNIDMTTGLPMNS
jgi:hypothetical protein